MSGKNFFGLGVGEMIVGAVIVGFLTAILFPIFLSAKAAAQKSHCMSNLKGLAYRFSMYATDYDDRLPDAMQWSGQVRPYLRSERFSCVDGIGLDYTYAMATAVSRKRIAEIAAPSEAPLLFDSLVMIPDAHGDLGLLPMPARHGGANWVVYVDGNARPKMMGPSQ